MAYKITLSSAQQQELRVLLKKERSVKIHRRLRFIEYKSKGASNGDIAAALGVCIDTLTDWAGLFLESGFRGLCRLKYEGRRLSRLEPVKGEIRKRVESGKAATLSALADWLRNNHRIAIQESGLFKFLKKNSLALTKRPA